MVNREFFFFFLRLVFSLRSLKVFLGVRQKRQKNRWASEVGGTKGLWKLQKRQERKPIRLDVPKAEDGKLPMRFSKGRGCAFGGFATPKTQIFSCTALFLKEGKTPKQLSGPGSSQEAHLHTEALQPLGRSGEALRFVGWRKMHLARRHGEACLDAYFPGWLEAIGVLTSQ